MSPFSTFCINCLLRFHFVYCNNGALKNVNGASYCTCSLVALRVPENCFWAAKTRKTLEFLRCIYGIDSVLKYGTDKIEGHWLQLLFLLHSSLAVVASVNGLSFLAIFQILDWKLLALHFDGNVCNWIPKVIWPRMDWSWSFLFENGFPRWLHIFTDWNRQELLNCYSFWWHQILSMFTSRGILVCSLKMLVLFSHRILQDWSRSSRKAMQLEFQTFGVFRFLCFLGSNGKSLWFFHKTN